MILCEWDAPEGHPGKCAYTCMLSSLTSVSIFSVWCYSSVSISVGWPLLSVETEANGGLRSTYERGPS
jgi:hypothetical protein